MRQRVSETAGQDWQEPVSACYLGRALRSGVRFKVPDLRKDGSPRGVDTGRWVMVRLPLWTLTLVWVIVTVALRLLIVAVELVIDFALEGTNAGGYDVPSLRWRRRIAVTAEGPGAGAVAFGRALRSRRGHLWIVTSPRRLALAQVADGRETVLWQAAVPDQPVLSVERAELRWPDGSQVTFEWPRGERRLLRAHHSEAAARP